MSVPDTAEAVAASHHLLQGGVIDWKVSRTIEVTEPATEVTVVK